MEFEIKKSTIEKAGLGLFTKSKILKNTVLGYYKGDILTPEEYKKINDQSRMYMLNETTIINGNNNMSYINDALVYDPELLEDMTLAGIKDYLKDPKNKSKQNVEFKNETDKVSIISIRDIEPEEELFIDYGNLYWLSRFFNS